VESKWKNYHIITFPGQSLSKTLEEAMDLSQDRLILELLISRNISVDTNTHKTIEELYGVVLPVRFAAKVYKECKRTVNRFLGQRPQNGPNRNATASGLTKNGPQRKGIVVPLPRNRNRNQNFPKM
jgi:hypothetical protein